MNIYVIRQNSDETYYTGRSDKFNPNMQKAKIYRRLGNAKAVRSNIAKKYYVKGSGGLDIIELETNITRIL